MNNIPEIIKEYNTLLPVVQQQVDNLIGTCSIKQIKRKLNYIYPKAIVTFCFIDHSRVCRYCKKVLILEDYLTDNIIIDKNRNLFLSTMCRQCRIDGVYIRAPERLLKMSIKAKEFELTERGKMLREKLGNHNSKNLKRRFATPEGREQIKRSAAKHSATLKKKIAAGEWSPCITNTWTHWDAKILDDKGILRKFRSSWEACFFKCNQYLEYETLRIKYRTLDGIDRVYVADFYDRDNKILYEIKPSSTFNVQKNKLDQAINWCIGNNIKFIWINEKNILQYINQEKFTTEQDTQQLDKLLRGILYEQNLDPKNY